MEDLRSTYPCPACPEDCGDFVMPEIVSEDCLDSIESELSEIKVLFIASVNPADKTKPIGGPADWTDSALWDAAIDNALPNKIRRVYGIGDIPEPTETTRTFHDNLTKVTNRQYLMTFDILSLAQVNYDAMRKLQCGGSLRVWFMTRGDGFYGGQDGIPVSINSAGSTFERGADAFKKIVLKLQWNAKCDPSRIASPWSEVAV